MKRMLVVTSLSITAVFLVTTLASGQSTVPIRAKAKQVTANTTPKRDRTRPYTFRTSGRVVPPPFCAAGVVPTVAGGNCVASADHLPAGHLEPVVLPAASGVPARDCAGAVLREPESEPAVRRRQGVGQVPEARGLRQAHDLQPTRPRAVGLLVSQQRDVPDAKPIPSREVHRLGALRGLRVPAAP